MFQVHPHQKSLVEPGCSTPTIFFKIIISIPSSSANNNFLDKFLSEKMENNNNDENHEQHPFEKLFSNESSATASSSKTTSWVVFRRFSEILTFHEYLCAKFTPLIIPKLQPKSKFERISAVASAAKAMIMGSLSSSSSSSTSASLAPTTTTTTATENGNNTNSTSNVDVSTLPTSGEGNGGTSSENLVLFFSQLEQLIDYHLQNNHDNNTNILNDSLVQEFLISPRIYFSQSSSSSNMVTGFETVGHKLLPKFGTSYCFGDNKKNSPVQESHHSSHDDDDVDDDDADSDDDHQHEKQEQIKNNNTNTSGRIPLEFPAIPLLSDSSNDDAVTNRPGMKFKYGCCQTCVDNMKLFCENQKTNNNQQTENGADNSMTATKRAFNIWNTFASTMKQFYDATITVAAASSGSSTTMMTSTASFFHLGCSETSGNNNNNNNNSLLSLKSLPSSIPLSQKSNNNASVKIDYGSAFLGSVQVLSNGSLVSISKFEHVKNIIHTLSSPEKDDEGNNSNRQSPTSPYQTIFCNLVNILIASQVSIATMKIHLEKQSLLNFNNNNNNVARNFKSSPSYNSITRNIIKNLESISSILGVSEKDENFGNNNDNNSSKATPPTCDDAIRILDNSILPHQSRLKNIPRMLRSIQLRGIAMLEMFVRVLIEMSSTRGMDEERKFLLLRAAHDEIEKREKGLIVSEMNQLWDFTLERLREREKRMMGIF